VCNMAITVFSGIFAQQMGMQADAIQAGWVANRLPGVAVVPSGGVAADRAQSKGCTYCVAE